MGRRCLILENGMVFEGEGFGAELSGAGVTGEVVFTTGMTGYLETVTDPSYCGQIVVQTFPLIGNYGVIPSDFENEKPALAAYIVHEWCRRPSNFRSEGELDTFFKERNVPALEGIDTRALTRVLRDHGVMNGRLVDGSADEIDAASIAASLAGFAVKDAVMRVTRPERCFAPAGRTLRRVVLWDFGAKANIIRELVKRGCEVVSVPADTTAEEIMAKRPDGVMLSNGPGDPTDNPGVIEEIKKLVADRVPMFGICLGHQLVALARGGSTYKLKFGHRGANQPARDVSTGRITVTSQNHGYAVDTSALPEHGRVSWINTNDGTCEGLDYDDVPVFTVQFHPEACSGPHDSNFLFDRFFENMAKGGKL